jgi:anti-anti-sigma factor
MITITEISPSQYEIKLGASFDFESHKDFRQHVKDIMAKKPERLNLNFEDVDYLDSSALGMLMLAKHEADAKGCALVITKLKDGHARKVIELVKFDQLFTIEKA